MMPESREKRTEEMKKEKFESAESIEHESVEHVNQREKKKDKRKRKRREFMEERTDSVDSAENKADVKKKDKKKSKSNRKRMSKSGEDKTDLDSAENDKAELEEIRSEKPDYAENRADGKKKKKNKMKRVTESEEDETDFAKEARSLEQKIEYGADVVIGLSAYYSKPRNIISSVSYAVQCTKCFKWRKLEKGQYELVNSNYPKSPFKCTCIGRSCKEVSDLQRDGTCKWIEDARGVLRIPRFKRKVVVRSDFSKADVYYHGRDMAGMKCVLRSTLDVDDYLKKNPGCNIKKEDFCFKIPAIDNTLSKAAGEQYLEQDEFEKAIEFYSKEVVSALSKRASAKTRLGDLKGAWEDMENAISVDPNNQELQRQALEMKDMITEGYRLDDD